MVKSPCDSQLNQINLQQTVRNTSNEVQIALKINQGDSATGSFSRMVIAVVFRFSVLLPIKCPVSNKYPL